MNQEKPNKTYIGGQAVLEGVMMRGKTAVATAVRDPEGNVQVESIRINEKKNAKTANIPVVRGCVNFVHSLTDGSKVLMRSAEVYGDEDLEPTKFEKWLMEKCKFDVMSLVLSLSTVLGVALAVGLFVLLPQFIVSLIAGWTNLSNVGWQGLLYNFIEGGVRILIFVLYILSMTLMQDIKRTFMYHGAEHKTITCFEKNLPLTVENVRGCSRVHDRCGTTFLFFVMLMSILVFSVANSLLQPLYLAETVVNYKVWNFIIRFVIKMALLPLVAGLSYELLKGLAKTESVWVKPLKAPGLLLQRITTREPDDEMIEVAIRAFKTVYEMDNDPSIPTQEFTVSSTVEKELQSVKDAFKKADIDESDAEWIVSIASGVARSQLHDEKRLLPSQVKSIRKMKDERLTGRPLWYVVGDTDFCGYTIRVDERVLIPRPETEQLVEEALKLIRKGDRVLELCTGSGAIAIAVSKETNLHVDASDISPDAIELARENALANGADVRFFVSDMFAAVEGKYDVILANPPYIKRGEIPLIQREVRDFEPYIALDGGDDGVDFYRIIAENVKNYLNGGKGCLVMEIGDEEAQDVEALFTDAKSVQVVRDLEGMNRIVIVKF